MSFAEPLALAFAGLYGVLIFFYLWERWRRRVIVPSLLLWETVHEDTIRARRFRPDVLFLLQLLLLTCLIVGLAQPYFRGLAGTPTAGRHIFVLDTSASMQAREVQRSRFDEARARAREVLAGLQAEAEVMLIGTAPAPEVLLGFTRDHDAVARALEQATVTDTGGDLAVALAFAESARQRQDMPTTMEVFTDIPRSQLPEPMRQQARVFQVGETDQNIGIEALQIFQGRFQDARHARAYVLVENFAHREGHGFLTVRLEDQVVMRSGFTIPPRESRGFAVHDFPGPGRVVAQLEVVDALAADNVAYGWVRPVRAVHVLLVSPPSPLVDDVRQLAAATPGFELAVVGPDAFRPEQARQFDLTIFHRFVPPAPAVSSALYIYPPRDNTLFPAAADAENVEVLDWDTHHAVLQSLRPLAALPLQRTRVLTAPPWSQVLLWSRTLEREFPLAFAGEYDGHRVACISFDVEAERLLSSDRVSFFMFFMNLLGWLMPAGDDALVTGTGEVEALAGLPAAPLSVRDPHGTIEALPAGQTTLQPRFAGEYRISADGSGRTLLANFFDPLESDIGRASQEPPSPPLPAPAPMTGPRAAGPAAFEAYGAWLYGAAAALFLLEWAVGRSRSA